LLTNTIIPIIAEVCYIVNRQGRLQCRCIGRRCWSLCRGLNKWSSFTV